MDNQIMNILADLRNGLLRLNMDDYWIISDRAKRLLSNDNWNECDKAIAEIILHISNILYNNTDLQMLPLEDGIYDLLLEAYRRYNPHFQVGAEPIFFEPTNNENIDKEEKEIVNPINVLEDDENALFRDEILMETPLSRNSFLVNPIVVDGQDKVISKRLVNTKHTFPELVGTLDKAKFVLMSEARANGVDNDPKVKVLERDFFGKHIEMGIINPNEEFTVVAELKYDGISVEAEILGNTIIGARTRGDANENVAADLTPILGNMPLPHAPIMMNDEVIGVKYEAVMTYRNLEIYNRLKGKNYKNCRTAISGLFSSSDAYFYRDLITLIPIASNIGASEEINRIDDLVFLNKYYHNGEINRYAVMTGNLTSILFQINRFVKESESLREFVPYMYDGVVISYVDKDKRVKLGRKNAINQYSFAVKFNPLRRKAIFQGYTYTIGQDGSITPMIHYTPVEFFGTVHTKSTGHSYNRFKTLNLAIGDTLDIRYTNDVMPYVDKDMQASAGNTNPPEKFIKECPSCGAPIEISKSGKSAFCPNLNCPERSTARITAALQKLGVVGFDMTSIEKLGVTSLFDIYHMISQGEDFMMKATGWGPVITHNFCSQMLAISSNPIEDFRIFGALGFTGIGNETMKLIFKHYTMQTILKMKRENPMNLIENLVSIKGIGHGIASTIVSELPTFSPDIDFILQAFNVVNSKDKVFNGKIIRCTGFRDKELSMQLEAMGHDANFNGSVTKKTNILLVPYKGFVSSKTEKVSDETMIIAVNDFKENMNKYLI